DPARGLATSFLTGVLTFARDKIRALGSRGPGGSRAREQHAAAGGGILKAKHAGPLTRQVLVRSRMGVTGLIFNCV
ncbi:MAG: hypothetical protein J2P51_15970, partial [Hyphomicrobiaceae bacterium]|nr:hypothetical protein [Hyphomicrobiaceae bacterium]